MSKLTQALNNEIRRLVRREAKTMVAPLRAAVVQLRREVWRVNRDCRGMERELSRVTPKPAGLAVPTPESAAKARLSSGLIVKLRKRLGLPLNGFAAVLGASGGSVYNWEHGKTKPDPTMRARLIATRQLGRRAAKRLVKAKIKPKVVAAKPGRDNAKHP